MPAVVALENGKLNGSRMGSLSSRQKINLREWLAELTKDEGSDRQ
jgi:hypothetical protein